MEGKPHCLDIPFALKDTKNKIQVLRWFHSCCHDKWPKIQGLKTTDLLPHNSVGWNQGVSRAVFFAGHCGASLLGSWGWLAEFSTRWLQHWGPHFLVAFAWRSFLASRGHLNSLVHDCLHFQSQCQISLRLHISRHSFLPQQKTVLCFYGLMWSDWAHLDNPGESPHHKVQKFN